MHILVTDRLSCPHCGPEFGLILRADQLVSRRVIEGCLACANCRAQYPVRAGFSDLRSPGVQLRPGEPLDGEEPEEALRLAALLGEVPKTGPVALIGGVAGQAGLLSEWLVGVELLAIHADLSGEVDRDGVSRLGMDVGRRLPFLSGSLGGVAVRGSAGACSVRELARVLAPGSRLVWMQPGDGVGAEMEASGLELRLLSTEGAVGIRK